MSISKINSLNSSFDFQNYDNNYSEIEKEDTLQNSFLSWDAFKYFPLKKKNASMQNKKWLNVSTQIIKIFMYGILYCTIFCSGVIIKFTFIFAISQLKDEKSIQFCDYYSKYDQKLEARISKKGKVIWTWHIIFMFLIPEFFTIFRSIWNFFFKKKVKLPKKQNILILFFLETFHSIGIALLIFYSLPKLNSIDVAAISSCICFIPTFLNLFTQHHKYSSEIIIFALVLILNVLALIVQGSGIILYSILNDIQDPLTWILPISLLLSSCRWWYNYISLYSYLDFIKSLARNKTDLSNNCYLLQGYVAIWRCLIFISSSIVILIFKKIQILEFFEYIWQNTYNIELIQISNSSLRENVLLSNLYDINDIVDIIADSSAPLYSFLIQAFCGFFIYQTAKFAYQTKMHKFGFAFPMSLVTPGTIFLIIIFCVLRREDACAFHNIIPDYLFLNMPIYNNIREFLINWRVWCWLMWWLSQIWITKQLWFGENEKLAPVEKIFYQSSYDSFLIDQFLGLNKKRHENNHITEEKEFSNITEFKITSSKEMQNLNNSYSTISKNDANNKRITNVTQIYVCATMWHEDKEEMNKLIGSILRLDKDQCAIKVTQKYYKIFINDYYELETHIIFDDAFCCMHDCIGFCNHNENETQVNEYVTTFIETIQENIKDLGILYLPPTKYPTPYGGQLIWNLPGKTYLIVHLKDKNKIRHRKRWSQVMYMYYFLGYRLMSTSMDVDTKELMAQNTYILTLDGDVDFHPTAVKSLLDLMKKDKELGAACGRIHPIGKGPMIWFQKFEYAMGHWLQKSTEHTIGSVLCSPGCFSLFRIKALMQDNVIAKYATKSTEPRHYIQYDQGEDRWLCTLILQAGCKVEYCAASDAYTHAPESFKEFYIQRRRWIPSTMANIFDLLNNSKETRKLNDNISWFYVTYQWILTGSTIIGPSFIYLMMVGAFVTCFQLNNWLSFWYNSIPIIIFILICFFCQERIQLIAAEVITIIYALVMIVVLVGIILQIATDGYFTPNTLLFFIVISQFIITAFLHPQELSCLPNGIIYYITVPSMYMLLIIFSIFNLHNITWGTRESKSRQILEQQSLKKSQCEQEKTTNKWTKSYLSRLFQCTFYTHKNSKEIEEYLEYIYNSINEINFRLKQIESNVLKSNIENRDNDVISISNENIGEKNNQNNIYNEEIKLQVFENLDRNTDCEIEISEDTFTNDYQENSNYLINPYWLQDKRLKNGKVDFLSFEEEEFWKQLIKKYLFPIENDIKKQQNITKELINIRNEYLLKFFMINITFIIAIFLLQINKDILRFQWPFAILYNITYVDEYEIHIYRKYMHLEPIGCLFIVAFVFILSIQFLAMLHHRLNTFIHVLANIKLNLFYSKKKDISNDISIHAKNIAENLQNTIDTERIFNLKDNIAFSSGKRKTVRELIEDNQNSSKRLSNFEILFHKQLQEIDTSGFSKTISSNISKDVLETKHHSNILTENKSQLENNTPNNTIEKKKLSKCYIYDNPTFLNDTNK